MGQSFLQKRTGYIRRPTMLHADLTIELVDRFLHCCKDNKNYNMEMVPIFFNKTYLSFLILWLNLLPKLWCITKRFSLRKKRSCDWSTFLDYLDVGSWDWWCSVLLLLAIFVNVRDKVWKILFLCPVSAKVCRGGLQWLRPYSALMGWKRQFPLNIAMVDIYVRFLGCKLLKPKHDWLVVSTHLKEISQDGNLPKMGLKIQNVEETTTQFFQSIEPRKKNSDTFHWILVV